MQKSKKIQPSSLTEYVTKFDELKTVFDSLPDGVVAILDKEMNIATANKAIAEMLQLQPENIVGEKISTVFSQKIPGLIDIIQQTLKTKKNVRNYTIESKTSSGESKSYLVSTTMINEISDSELGVVLIMHDVSEMIQLRKIRLQMNRYGEVLGKSEEMKKNFALIESIKRYDTSVLIVGETGTGKEVIARAIHDASNRQNKPFLPVNCSALPDNLIESELFGHEKGAFTGALTTRPGRFMLADGGTLW
jgi:two-component system response regulator HydG